MNDHILDVLVRNTKQRLQRVILSRTVPKKRREVKERRLEEQLSEDATEGEDIHRRQEVPAAFPAALAALTAFEVTFGVGAGVGECVHRGEVDDALGCETAGAGGGGVEEEVVVSWVVLGDERRLVRGEVRQEDPSR